MSERRTVSKKVAVIGGGLVGALQACFLAKRGFDVDLFESRLDIRKLGAVRGRSINLALSTRGKAALAAVGLEEVVTETGIPMYARMIHNLDGSRFPIQYGKKDQFIMSIDRRQLNEVLLTAAEAYPNVRIHFGHKFSNCNFNLGETTMTGPDGEEVKHTSDVVIGCDGAYSNVRKSMMKSTRLNFSQQYIPHGYMELRIPPKNNNEFAMETNYLHIWPRNKYMMIALPNTADNSFVVTLFMPFAIFESLKTTADILAFFEENFPDSIPLIGRDELVTSFRDVEPLPLVCVKVRALQHLTTLFNNECDPYNIEDKCVIMGDAAHAMVPFYGQGMNCGFEDCLVFDGFMETMNNDIGKVLPEYAKYRNPDAKAIVDLAMYNYVEMREHVNSRLFRLRKKLDNVLYMLMPRTWVPLYTMVSFTRTPYQQCIERREWQDKVLGRVLRALAVCGAVGGGLMLWRVLAPHSHTAQDFILNNVYVTKFLKLF